MTHKDYYLIVTASTVICAPPDASEDDVRAAAMEVAQIAGQMPTVLVTDAIGYHLKARMMRGQDLNVELN